MRWSGFYRAGGAMGFSPEQIDGMTLWEFEHTANGYTEAHVAEDEDAAPPMEEDRLAQLGIEGFKK